MFIEQTGRDPTEEELEQWLQTVREAKDSGTLLDQTPEVANNNDVSN